MSRLPRILAIMGSGETAPTMAKVHRALFERLGDAAPAVILDTPYGFQENADELSARTVEFFATSVGRQVGVASYRATDADAVTTATALARVREARYVMAGPGSPSYALRTWAGGPFVDALAAKATEGGILTMASAAALTLGVAVIPVYEIYKVGEEPHWLEGLDLLGRATGLRAAVVPHYDNAEGGSHDTRFCYMGERRLRLLERALPAGVFILGVDGHTALVLDLEAGTAAISGLGGVTVRSGGRSAVLGSGGEVAIEALGSLAAKLAAGGSIDAGTVKVDGRDAAASAGPVPLRTAHLRDSMAKLEGSFIHALDTGDTRAAVAALLDLDDEIISRIRAGEDSPDLDNASATLRSLVVRLGERAKAGSRDPHAALEPFVETLLEVRRRARDASDWPTADLIRDRLAAAGVEVRDETSGTTWSLRSQESGGPSRAAG